MHDMVDSSWLDLVMLAGILALCFKELATIPRLELSLCQCRTNLHP